MTCAGPVHGIECCARLYTFLTGPVRVRRSVGVLLYVLLTGCSPFGGETKQETFCNISQCRLDFPDDLFEDVSDDAKDLMRRLIVKDPK